jgi:hypothetical protein
MLMTQTVLIESPDLWVQVLVAILSSGVLTAVIKLLLANAAKQKSDAAMTWIDTTQHVVLLAIEATEAWARDRKNSGVAVSSQDKLNYAIDNAASFMQKAGIPSKLIEDDTISTVIEAALRVRYKGMIDDRRD